MTHTISQRKFYIADCSIDEIEVASVPNQKGKVDSWALGRASLVAGELELHFNWAAQGGDTDNTAFDFTVFLDEETPDFELVGFENQTPAEQDASIQQILLQTTWQREVLECLPKNPTELAKLD